MNRFSSNILHSILSLSLYEKKKTRARTKTTTKFFALLLVLLLLFCCLVSGCFSLFLKFSYCSSSSCSIQTVDIIEENRLLVSFLIHEEERPDRRRRRISLTLVLPKTIAMTDTFQHNEKCPRVLVRADCSLPLSLSLVLITDTCSTHSLDLFVLSDKMCRFAHLQERQRLTNVNEQSARRLPEPANANLLIGSERSKLRAYSMRIGIFSSRCFVNFQDHHIDEVIKYDWCGSTLANDDDEDERRKTSICLLMFSFLLPTIVTIYMTRVATVFLRRLFCSFSLAPIYFRSFSSLIEFGCAHRFFIGSFSFNIATWNRIEVVAVIQTQIESSTRGEKRARERERSEERKASKHFLSVESHLIIDKFIDLSRQRLYFSFDYDECRWARFRFSLSLSSPFGLGRILYNVPCSVCHDNSSGKHYSVYACDG